MEKERQELAQRLDAELDKFMEELAANQKSSGPKKAFNFEDWCKDIDQHPAFLSRRNKVSNGDAECSDTSDAFQALMALKNSDSTDDAQQYKDEGNNYFKLKKYRQAVETYTNGLKLMCPDRQLNSILYANRAAAHKHLGNLRSAIKDCLFARKFNPENLKAVLRGAECLLELGYSKRCLEWIDSSRIDDKEDISKETTPKLESLRAKAKSQQMKEERDIRRNNHKKMLENQKKYELLRAFRQRQLKFSPKIDGDDDIDLTQLEVSIVQTEKTISVYFDKSADLLVWPLLLQYPQFGQTDFITDCAESSTFEELLSDVLGKQAEWDHSHQIRDGNIRMFIAIDVFDEELVREITSKQRLGEVLTLPDVIITRGLPVIQVYSSFYLEGKIELLRNDIYRFKKK